MFLYYSIDMYILYIIDEKLLYSTVSKDQDYAGLGIRSLVFQANHLLFENERGKVLFAIFKV